jgi:alpha-1,2-mannosyltransferase
LVAPDASFTYWTQMVLDTSRSGGGGYPDNQSLTGVLARVLRDDTPPVWITLPVQGLALAAAYLVARRATATRHDVMSVLAVAIGGLLASPVSWSHHWVWAAPMVMTLLGVASRAHAVLTAAVFTIPPLAVSPLGWLTDVPRAVWVPATCLFPLCGIAWLASVWGYLRGARAAALVPVREPESVTASALVAP